MVTVTKELMEQGLSRNGSWSDRQVKVLTGQTTLNNPGWLQRLYGTLITEQQKTEFLRLKDKHLKVRSNEQLGLF